MAYTVMGDGPMGHKENWKLGIRSNYHTAPMDA